MLYNKDVVSSVLTFIRHLDQLKRQPILQPGEAPVVRRRTDLEADPSQPSNLCERTMHAFAQQNIPISQPLSLPVLSISLTCPGKDFRGPCALQFVDHDRQSIHRLCLILHMNDSLFGMYQSLLHIYAKLQPIRFLPTPASFLPHAWDTLHPASSARNLQTGNACLVHQCKLMTLTTQWQWHR